VQERLPDRSAPTLNWNRLSSQAAPAASYDGVAWRRSAAFLIDMVILFSIVAALWLLNILTLFIFSAVLGLLGPVIIFLAYDTVLIGGSGSASIGMRLMGLKMVNAQGGKVEYFQAFLVTALFYISASLTMGLVLLVALFNERGRCLHDMMTGVFVVNVSEKEAHK